MKFLWLFYLVVAPCMSHCSEAALKGGSRGSEPAPAISSTQIPVQSKDIVSVPKPVPTPIPTTEPPSLPSPTPTKAGVNIDGTLGGQEIINSCDRCIQRAMELSPKAGFNANINATANEGFYKIDPSKGLCDIHFLPNLNTEIGDHEGFDSVLSNQIALYCPCNCPWARNDSNNFGSPAEFVGVI